MPPGGPSQGRRAWLPWAALFAFPLLALYGNLTELLALDWAPLVVPFAALLGHRYDRRGLMVVALGGLFLVPELRFTSYFGLGGRFDLWLISIAACALAARRQPPEQWLPRAPMSNLALAVFVVLPFTFGIWGTRFDELDVGAASE
jgi:hypothetical protein